MNAMAQARHLFSQRRFYSHVPVIISGAGPTGLTLSAYLSRYGVVHKVFERSRSLLNHPQAHFINNRTMEVFRPLGGLASEVAQLTPPLEHWRRFVYCQSMAGRLLGAVDHFPGQEHPTSPLSPEPLAHLPQNRLLQLLAKRVEAAGPGILCWGQKVTRVQQEGSRVSVQVDAGGQQQQHSCDWLVAADGASSSIRQQLGVAMRGEAALQHLINVHFTSPALGAAMLARPGAPAMLYFVFNSQVVAVLVAHNLAEGEFVAQLPYFPPVQAPADFPAHPVCEQLLAAAAGMELQEMQPLTIHSVRPWTMGAQVAERLQLGRVLLAGDAAHAFPPAGGFGMNTGVQDASNLAWKLAAVVGGRAGAGLVGSYEAERRAVATANTALSVANWHDALQVPEQLGLALPAAQLLSRAAAALPLPSSLAKGLLAAGLRVGRSWSEAPGLPQLRDWRQARLDALLADGGSLRLQFPAEDLGFSYASGAVLPEPAAAAPGSAPQRRGAPYVPCSAPGHRFPHVWLSHANGSGRLSSLDVVSAAGTSMTLFVPCRGPGSKHDPNGWLQAGMQLLHQGWPLQVVQVLMEPGDNGSSSGVRHVEAQQDQQHVLVDVVGSWHKMTALPEGSAALVRPDGHVAWRQQHSPSEPLERSVQQLANVMKHVLHYTCSGLDSRRNPKINATLE